MFVKFFKSETDLFMVSKTYIVPYFEAKIERLFLEDRFSSSSSYELALKSLMNYHPNELNFKNIDEKFLKGYVAYMLSKGNSTATAGIYLRNLRSIYNDVIKAGIMPESSYPFRAFKFRSKLKSKDVLYPQQLKQLLNYETTDEREKRAIAFFFFCYTCNGMNFQDAGLLQYKNIQRDILTFVRHKTKSTGKEIKVYIHDLTREIIKKWGNPNQNPEAYIFGLVPPEMTPFEVQQKLY